MYNANHISCENCTSVKLIKLVAAINDGDKGTLKALSKDTRLINTCDTYGWTPLMHAIKRTNLEFIKILCQCGATANVKDGHFRTPLMMASRLGLTNIVQFLATKTFDLNAIDVNGMSAFMHAAKNGHLGAVAELFDNGIDPSLKDKNGFTAFMLASIEHHTEILDFFQQKKIDVDCKDKKMWNYYLDKVVRKNMEEIKKLRQSGSNVSILCPEEMRDHPFIELLQKSGCRISSSKERRSQHKHLYVATPTDETRHQYEPCGADQQLSDSDEPLSCPVKPLSGPDEPLSGSDKLQSGPDELLSCPVKPMSDSDEPLSGSAEPLSGPNEPLSGSDKPLSGPNEPLSTVCEAFAGKDSSCISKFSDTDNAQEGCQGDHPVLRKKSTHKYETAVLDLRVPSTYTSLKDKDLLEESTDKVDAQAALHFLPLTEEELQLINVISNPKTFRNKEHSVDETPTAENGKESVVRRNTHTKGKSRRRAGLYSPSLICPTRNYSRKLIVKANTLPRVKNMTIYINFDIQDVEYLATDGSNITINKRK